MKTQRILHLIDTGGPGGAETIFLELVTRLPSEGWDNIAIVPSENWLAENLRKHGVTPIFLTTSGRFDLNYLRDLRRIASDYEVDLIQSHLLTSSVYGTVSNWGRRRPVISTFHGLPDIPIGDRLASIKARILRSDLTRIICVSGALRDHFVDTGLFGRERVDVIRNGIDCSKFRAAKDAAIRHACNIPDAVPIIGAVGNVRPSKAYDTLLHAFSLVLETIPHAHLVVVGQTGGVLFEKLLTQMGSLGISEQVHFTGYKDDVHRLLRGMDLFALSSRDEGFSLATVQAMATEVPVVATRCGGPEEIIEDGVSGLLVPHSNPRALADAIILLERDGELARRLGTEGRKTAQALFSVDAMVRRYSALYSERIEAIEG